MNKQEAQVILLPTDNASNLSIYCKSLHCPNGFGDKYKKDNNWDNQFYYVLSNEEIKEGDWVLINNAYIRQCTKAECDIDTNCLEANGFNAVLKTACKKIIATNDESLQWAIDKSPYPMEVYGLPQLSQQGLELLCKLYNEKKELKVIVEYEDKWRIINGYKNQPKEIIGFVAEREYYNELKVDSQNCISIS